MKVSTILGVSFGIALLVVGVTGCSGDTPAATQKAASKALVTFIELGSDKCVPCIMMRPVMEEIQKKYAGQVDVVFHDVWTAEGQPYGRKYRIRVIPTQIFLDAQGAEYFRHEGYFPVEQVEEVLVRKGVKKR